MLGRSLSLPSTEELAHKPFHPLHGTCGAHCGPKGLRGLAAAGFADSDDCGHLNRRPRIPLVSRLVSRSLTGNFASEQETAVPPKFEKETRTSQTPPLSDEFVSARNASLPKSRKVPEYAQEFARAERQKQE